MWFLWENTRSAWDRDGWCGGTGRGTGQGRPVAELKDVFCHTFVRQNLGSELKNKIIEMKLLPTDRRVPGCHFRMVAWLWKILHEADVSADWVVPGGEDKLQVGHSKATHHPANSFSIPQHCQLHLLGWRPGWYLRQPSGIIL